MNVINDESSKNNRAIYIIGALFFVFGFITWSNSVLIPYLKIACELSNFAAYLVAFAFYISYFVMAIPSAWILQKTGFKKGMSLGLAVIGFGALLFIPAALMRAYPLFLLGLFVQGTGLSILQTASNPYITILGPIESAAKRISMMGVCNKFAGILAPIILGAITLKGADELTAKIKLMDVAEKSIALNLLANRVILPYVIIALILVVLAIAINYSSLPEVDADSEDSEMVTQNLSKTSILDFPHLILGVISLFLYVGVEVMAGDTIIAYGSSQGISLDTAKFFTSCTLIAMLIGYFAGIAFIPKYLSQKTALTISAISGVVFSLVAILTTGYVSVLFIALLGLSNALMWPAIWPLSISGLGRFTKIGSSLLIMAIAGGAVLPLLYGYISDQTHSLSAGYWIMIPAYLFILYFAVAGHKLKLKK
jgi:MFS transporter, FHS family, L-fucose permease